MIITAYAEKEGSKRISLPKKLTVQVGGLTSASLSFVCGGRGMVGILILEELCKDDVCVNADEWVLEADDEWLIVPVELVNLRGGRAWGEGGEVLAVGEWGELVLINSLGEDGGLADDADGMLTLDLFAMEENVEEMKPLEGLFFMNPMLDSVGGGNSKLIFKSGDVVDKGVADVEEEVEEDVEDDKSRPFLSESFGIELLLLIQKMFVLWRECEETSSSLTSFNHRLVLLKSTLKI